MNHQLEHNDDAHLKRLYPVQNHTDCKPNVYTASIRGYALYMINTTNNVM